MSKDEAIIKVLKVLKSPMMVINKHNREEALTIAIGYRITMEDLIDFAHRRALEM